MPDGKTIFPAASAGLCFFVCDAELFFKQSLKRSGNTEQHEEATIFEEWVAGKGSNWFLFMGYVVPGVPRSIHAPLP
jgi:hypothetical protein